MPLGRPSFRIAVLMGWCSLSAVMAQPALPAAAVRGVVYEKTSDSLRPLPRAFVSILSASGEILATGRTDDRGRYEFSDLPASHISFTASKPGYLLRKAAGGTSSRATVDCSRGCTEAGMDFELFRGAVVAGVIYDPMREPFARAILTLQPVRDSSRVEKPVTGATDDRGRFRFTGLQAGSYRLIARRRVPGGQHEEFTRDFSIGEGEQVADLGLMMGAQDPVRAGGTVSGIPVGEGYRVWVELRPVAAPGGDSPRAIQANVEKDGRFQFDSVLPGRYRADAAVVKAGSAERTDYLMNTIDVLGETSQISLHPSQPAAVAGGVTPPVGILPGGTVIRLISKEGFGDYWTRISNPGLEFDFTGLRPGTYRMETDSPKFYVAGIQGGGSGAGSGDSPAEVKLSPGANRLTVLLAADQGRVSGTVHNPAGNDPLPNAQVALYGERGRYVARTDTAGRYAFDRVVPGEYRICALTSPPAGSPADPAVWEQAGCPKRVVPVDPSGKIEIDLKAVR